MTLACGRCRTKKVKCDFTHPVCKRCQQAKAECSYTGSATQLDLFHILKINETVEKLQHRIRGLEEELIRVHRARARRRQHEEEQLAQYPQWNMSLTQDGLRIDTNIMSMHGLYHILFAGHVTAAAAAAAAASYTDEANGKRETTSSRELLWKSGYKSFPLYCTWDGPRQEHEGNADGSSNNGNMSSASSTISSYSSECHSPATESAQSSAPSTPIPSSSSIDHVPRDILHALVVVYDKCFLCFTSPRPHGSILKRFQRDELDPFLANTIFAWAARHATICHNLFPGQDPSQIGEKFFIRAKDLLMERFMTSDVDTVHGLLVMHNYVIGKAGEKHDSEAYMYLGLALRMCFDLGLHRQDAGLDPIELERNRRCFWSCFFFETLCSLNTDKPAPPDDVFDVPFPSPLPHELNTPIQWRVEFMGRRFEIIRIYHSLTSLQAVDAASIEQIGRQAQRWYDSLPSYFRFDADDPLWKTPIKGRTWLREFGCLKLNLEYNHLLCQIHSVLRFHGWSADAKRACRTAADTIVDLMGCWATALPDGWCHVSLEPPTVAVMVYSHFLSDAHVRQRLRRLVQILQASPMHHRRHVMGLLERIHSFLLAPPTTFPSAYQTAPASRVVGEAHHMQQTITDRYPTDSYYSYDWDWFAN
ncbi:fungal-specific transcription factor domain-domain-containing protein [Syncephalastrum racemosum]|uniref:Fungal-specific transcription factor domain-domain-containing protein n=1 Tax=Syncephalastrum racemosum TaxID=13706 RepID=A0A1X2H3W0_SYNRA|nr:fungal-specific transcription factor domain-domain-containing protein [Syncephalastrum racemosum]